MTYAKFLITMCEASEEDVKSFIQKLQTTVIHADVMKDRNNLRAEITHWAMDAKEKGFTAFVDVLSDGREVVVIEFGGNPIAQMGLESSLFYDCTDLARKLRVPVSHVLIWAYFNK